MGTRENSQGVRGRGYGRRLAGVLRRHTASHAQGQEEEGPREPFPIGVEEPEASQFDDEIWGRPEEVVLVTRTAAESAALRKWGALAIARPETGWWCSASLQVLEDRDIVFVDADAASQFGWAADDVEALAGVVARVGLLVPDGCGGEAPSRDLAAFADRERQRKKGPEGLVREAEARLMILPERDPGAAADGDWPSLRRGERPEGEPFPVDVFPDPVARFVREAADGPADFAGLAVLVVAGAAAGRSAALRLKADWCVTPALFGLNVGGPASGASAALRAVTQPLRVIDQRLYRAYRQAKAEHDRAARQAQAAKTEPPARPSCQTALLEDCALDVVVGHLARNPRGVLVARDEAETWVLGLRGGRSAERRLWFSSLDGHALRLDDKGGDGAGAIRLDGPFLAFCGNIAPELLPALGAWEAGVLDRALVAFPDALPRAHWSDAGLSDEARRSWSEVIDRLRGRVLREDGTPEEIALADDARAEWVHWYNAQADAINAPGADGEAQAAATLLSDFAARLALIVHLLGLACHPTRGVAEPLPPVSRSALVAGLRLASYFRAQHRRARCEMDGGRGSRVTRAIVDWVRRTGKARFSVSELTHSLRWIADWRGEPEAALRLLVGQNAIRRVQVKQGQSPKGGRPRSPLYEVHPGLKGT